MEIYKVKVYDMDEAVIASGYPMLPKYEERYEPQPKDWTRAFKLAAAPTVSGHCNFVKGILVAMDIVASTKWWIQAGRYSHFNIVSSMSTMHKSLAMSLKDVCVDVPKELIDFLEKQQQKCIDGELTLTDFVSMLPSGLRYGARISTNYLQLRIMYNQRKDHRLVEWKQFCEFCKTLPKAEMFITCDDKVKEVK